MEGNLLMADRGRYVYVLEEHTRVRDASGKPTDRFSRYKVCGSLACAQRWAMTWATNAKNIVPGGQIVNASARCIRVEWREPGLAWMPMVITYDIEEREVEQTN